MKRIKRCKQCDVILNEGERVCWNCSEEYRGIERISDIAKELGKIGGRKTVEKYGREHFVEMGKKSGKARRKNKCVSL